MVLCGSLVSRGFGQLVCRHEWTRGGFAHLLQEILEHASEDCRRRSDTPLHQQRVSSLKGRNLGLWLVGVSFKS